MNTSKELVKNYMKDVWENRQVEKLKKYISSNLVQHNPNLENGLDALKGFLPILFNDMMPQGSWEVKRIIAEENLVVVHSLAKPAPQHNGMAVVDIFKVENDMITEHWDVSAEIPEKTASGNTVV